MNAIVNGNMGAEEVSKTEPNWLPGMTAWFEYHCNESHRSPDAPVWYRSHQQVTVLAKLEDSGLPGSSYKERIETGHVEVFHVRFQDGLEWDVFEDELLESRAEFERPDPPQNCEHCC